jgi:hypothetical protein
MLNVLGRGLLDPDGVHTHSRDDCPRVRRLHPEELRGGFTAGRTQCPNCADLIQRETRRTR